MISVSTRNSVKHPQNTTTIPINYKRFNKIYAFYIIASIICFNLLVVPIQSCSSYKTSSKIRLEKNGYKNILIAIGEDVEENYELIDNIKSAYTEASSLLFNVTK